MGILGAILLFIAFSIFNALGGDFHGISIIAKVMFGMGIFFIFGFFVLFLSGDEDSSILLGTGVVLTAIGGLVAKITG